jgi:hypothetical protein
MVLDTWSSAVSPPYDYSGWKNAGGPTSLPLQIRVLALQITLRVWDAKTQQTRQMTITQDV